MIKKKDTKDIKRRIARYGTLSALLATAVNVQGQIIYTDVDPDFNGGIGSNYSLDLDNNGTGDFSIFVQNQGSNVVLKTVTTEPNNGGIASYSYALALNQGDNISSGIVDSSNSIDFKPNLYMASLYSSSYCYGNWCNQTDKFLGFKFDIDGDTHYGWARLSTSSDENNIFVLHDYAYNSEVGMPIQAGEVPFVDQVPTAVCADFTTMLDENGMATIEPSNLDGGSSDGEGDVSLTISQESFDCAEVGTLQSVVLTVTDSIGQIATCDALVTIVDQIPPIITCPDNSMVLTELGTAEFETPDYVAIGMASATDNCTSPIVITQDPVAGTMLPTGVQTITFTGADASGNEETCSFDLTVELASGTLDQSLSTVAITPNPASNFIQLKKPAHLEISNVEILDVAGKLIKTIKLSQMENEKLIDISQLHSGLYFFVLQSEKGKFVKKIVKQ